MAVHGNGPRPGTAIHYASDKFLTSASDNRSPGTAEQISNIIAPEIRWFERVSMLVILLNCVTLGMYQPCEEGNCDTTRCKILQVFDDFIFAFFTLEMAVKMIAMGIYGKGTYLADSWNRLDFFIVLAGALEYCLNVENKNLSAIRTIRVLRPLRAINRIPSMRILVMLLLDTLPMLGNVLLLCFFVFFIFGIVGVQLWQGILRQRCYLKQIPNVSYPEPLALYYQYIEQDKDYICSRPDDNGMHKCDNLPHYREGDMICNDSAVPNSINRPTDTSCVNWNQYYTECMSQGSNPFQGTISFDNIGLAWVAIFLVISLEGWTDIMYYVQDAHSFWDWIYFVLLIVIGSFFMINLCLVVIATQFSETKKREMERMRLERARFHSTSTLASSTNNSEPTTCYAEIVKYVAHLWRRAKRKLLKNYRVYRYKKQHEQDGKLIIDQNTTDQGTGIPSTGFSTQYCGGHDGPGPPIHRYSHHHCHHHRQTQYRHVYHSCPHAHHTCRHHFHCKQSTRHISCLSPPATKPADAAADDQAAPHASPEASDIDPQGTPRRFNPAGLLRVPSNNNTWNDNINEGGQCGSMLLSPPSTNGQRRRSSVMFSDEVTTLAGETKNVCSSEKMTQTVDGELWQSGRSNESQVQSLPDLNLPEIGNETMTCQELLAFSGALSAALPTGQLALESLFNSLAKGAQERSDCSQRWIEADRCSCCGELQTNVYPVCPSPEWSILVDGHKDSLVSKSRRGRFGNFWREFGKCILYCLCNIRRFIKALVEHKYFQQGILLAILFNTLSMGIEYHNQPQELTVIVEISNIVFSAIFAVEMLLKIVAEGPFGYVSNGFNVFDGVIVILSVVELCQTFLDSEGNERGGSSGLSVLRTFRLLRILKLVRFMPNLRRQLFVMLRTMDNVAVFFSLLILFIFIFSILGMYLFGGKFCMLSDGSRECTCIEISLKHPDCVCDRKHFNNFLWATVTVFQILTQEDWNVVLFNGMEKTSHWAALYFVALMTFGNYVLFNLLVAILVEGFSSERNERREREARELEKQREKAAEIAAALFEEATRSSSSSESAGMTLNERMRSKWRSAEDIHQSSFKTSKVNAKDGVWKLKQNLDLKKSEAVASPPMPPLITHTAATPQDSPNTTVDPNVRDFTNKITPTSAFYSSSLSIDSIDRSASSQSSIPGLLKPPKNQIAADESVPDSSRLNVNRNLSPSKKTNSPCTPRRVCSWRVTRPSLKRKLRRGSGTIEGSGNQEQEVILNNNHIHLLNGSDHSRCNGNLAVTNTIRNDTQSHKSLSPQSSIRSRLSSRDSAYAPLPQIAWSEANTIHQVSSKKDNLNQAIITNGAKTNEKNSGQNEPVHPKTINISSGSVAPSESPNLSKVAANDEQVITLESGENLGPTSVITETIPKVFYFFEHTGCFKERDNFSLYIFPPDNKFRQSCTWIVERKWFDNVVLLFIGLNCITLAMERPNIPPDSTERTFLLSANYIFTVVFALEMMVKVIATGMFYGENAYFTSGWNIMDGSLVIISIVDLLMSLLSESSPRIFGILRVFRLLRSLRPLRVINRAPGLKLVVQTLLSSLRPIGNIVLICCTFFIIFGILGVQLFKGTFYYCEGPTLEGVRNKTDCLLADSRNQWINRKYNFDDLGKALMSLFVLSSRDGWVNIMYTGLDAVGVDLQPVKNYSEWRLLYFIAFILLVGFFVLNMFVGVVVENFHRCREEQEKEERMLRLAKRAKQMEKKRRKMHEPPYYINYSKPRLVIHNVVTSKYFDLAIAAVIGLNVVTMAMEFHLMPRPLTYALKIFNYFFTAVFILELIMKLVALGVKLYLKDRWNQLDVAIVFLSIVGIVLEELESKIIPINPTIIRVMRVLRIARVLKLLKMAKGIRALLDTVMQALPQVGNLGLLFFLLFFIFAALGVELFGRLECSDELPCQGLGEHAHFANFGMAFLTLFRVATGDNWNGIMKDTLRDNCDDTTDCVKNCCVSTIIAPIFFVIFVLMAQFVLVNVVVAVLMKHLEESHKQMEDELDMEVELERELQQEQEVIEEELCLQALNAENQAINPIKRPLGKVLSLPANFIYHAGSSSKDSSVLKIDEPGSRRGSSISYQSSYRVRRRQTLHAYSSLFPPSYPVTGYTSVYTTDQDGASNKSNETKKAETVLDRKRLLRRMSSIDSRRRTSVSAISSRRGSLIRPRTELQTLLSKSVGLAQFPTPKQLLSLTELVVDEKEREKRILRKALSMETRSPSDDISPDCLSPGSLMIPPPYPGEKSFLKAPEEEKHKRSERRPSLWQTKQEASKAEEIFQRNLPRKSVSLEKRKSIFKQMSLDSKQALYDKSKEISPEEIAMIIQERRPPHLRDVPGKDIRADEVQERRSPVRRQMTAPSSETTVSRLRRPSLTRQERQEAVARERATKSDEKDDLQLSVLERRSSLLKKLFHGGAEETAETTLGAPEKAWRPPRMRDSKFFGASMETTSTSSNSTNITNLRSDSVVSEDTEKDSKNEALRKEEHVEEGGGKEMEKKSGSKERLIGTSSEECCDTSEEDKPKTHH